LRGKKQGSLLFLESFNSHSKKKRLFFGGEGKGEGTGFLLSLGKCVNRTGEERTYQRREEKLGRGIIVERFFFTNGRKETDLLFTLT